MATQTIIWTALPGGVARLENGDIYARLSAYVSFRLEANADEGDTLGLYPDVLNWTKTLQGISSFRLEFDNPNLVANPKLLSQIDNDWWGGLFNEQTYVKPYVLPDYTDRLIVSYPVANIARFVKELYQRVGLNNPNELPELLGRDQKPRVGGPLFDNEGFPWNKDLATSTRRRMAAEFFNSGGVLRDNVLIGEFDNALAFQSASADPRIDLRKLLLFHYPPEKLNTTEEEDEKNVQKQPPPLPKDEVEFERYMDFHQVVSSLGDYPVLMRQLGLVLDFAVPLDEIPPNAQFVRIIPQWGDDNGGPDIISESPFTAFSFSAASDVFRTRSRGSGMPRITESQLHLNPPRNDYELVEIDVDGAALKLIGLSNTMASSSSLLAVDTPTDGGLPSLRSSGLSLNLTGRAAHTHNHFQRVVNNDQGSKSDLVLYAEDVLRGYRVDIWDTQTNDWHSLCQRVGSFVVEGTDLVLNDVVDEGFAQMAMTEQAPPEEGAPPKSTDLYLHESMFRWDGWSLVAPRPGKTIGQEGDSNSPMSDPQPQPMMPFKLVTRFKAAPRTLPRLRFGVGYRIRVRVVDLAGNSPLLGETGNEHALPPVTQPPRSYLRFEPVGSPSVYLREAITETDAGESLARLVIRSYNSSDDLDTAASTEVSERHIAPPPSSEQILETHGTLDDVAGRLKNDPATYALLSSRSQPVDPTATDAPVFPEEQMPITYMPDPMASGAALRDLPATTNETVGIVDETGAIVYTPLEGIHIRPGSVLQIPYSASPSGDPLTDLLNEQSFRIVVVDPGSTEFFPPSWDNVTRTLSIGLPKTEEISFALSSYMHRDNLPLMGVWDWIREFTNHSVQSNLGSPDVLEQLSTMVVNCVQYAVEGGHWMLTPSRKITLVHPVQQPIGYPEILVLSSSRNEGDTSAFFVGVIQVHGKSTLTINLIAKWEEPVDDLSAPGPEVRSVEQQVDDLTLRSLSGGLIKGTKKDKYGIIKNVGSYAPERDWLSFAPNASLTHEFGDTKHRMIHYKVIAGSRFREYFAADVAGGFTRDSESMLVNVPSSARPSAPLVRYMLPTYGWKRETSTNLIASYRQGGGLRVYMDRGWYSSGEGELLGVVLWQGYTLDNEQRHLLSRYITQWGMDPIRKSAPTPDLPSTYNFRDYEAVGYSLLLPELANSGVPSDNKVDVVGYPVHFDDTRGLWYCDIDLDPGASYYPFIRLALARYQPSSITGMHLSRVTLAEFAQLAPERSTILTYDPYDDDTINLVVSGYTYTNTADTSGISIADSSQFVISVEKRNPDLYDELAWTRDNEVTITAEQVGSLDRVLWKGHIRLPVDHLPGQYRIVVEEYEQLNRRIDVTNLRVRLRKRDDFIRDQAVLLPTLGLRATRRPIYSRTARLVYADVIEL